MPQFEDIGFVIVNYRTPELTQKCIECVRSLYSEVSIVIVDNSPNCEQNTQTDRGDIIYLPQKSNVGFGAAVNLGAASLRALKVIKYLVLLNSDAVIYEGFLEFLCPLLQIPGIGMVAPVILDNETQPQIWCAGGRFSSLQGGVDLKYRGERIAGYNAFYSEFASGCALLMSLETFWEIGGFDQRFFMYEEDLDLSLRILGSGQKIAIHDEVIVTHIRQGSHQCDGYIPPMSIKNPNVRFYLDQIVSNRVCVLIVNSHLIGRGRALLALLSFLSRKTLYYLWRGKISLCRDVLRAFGKGVMLSREKSRRTTGNQRIE